VRYPRVIPYTSALRVRGGRHRWKVKAPNGRILSGSSEGYHNLDDMEHGIFETCVALMRWWYARNPQGFSATVGEIIESARHAHGDESHEREA
jgi:hypothetical protein